MAETRHAIRPLDPLVVGKIAAGEVVERPAFAIKELMENSIDAGATAVMVDIRDGGLTFFRVTDNGCGIVPEDIRMAFARHATSKLRTAEELTAIHTLGFRGEALASIAAVSRVEMTTRAAGRETGVKATVVGGVIEGIRDAASPEGTAITVRDLFFNVPARRKFLKKPTTETALVSDLVMRLILARPDISFRLTNAEKTVYHSPGNGSLRDALFGVLGREALSSLVEVRGSAAGCAVYGFVGIGEAARSSRAMQTFILNGRYVRNAFLSQALEEGCREKVMIGKYPVCALHLTMPFEAVDVNVHPNKLEVRFQEERLLMEGMAGVIRAAFEADPLRSAPKVSFIEPMPTERGPGETASHAPVPPAMRMTGAQSVILNRPSVRMMDAAIAPPIQTDRPTASSMSGSFSSSWEPSPPSMRAEPEQITLAPTAASGDEKPRVVGVAWLEYIFAEQGDRLYLIDQHAAHERILYERFRQALDRDTLSQRLLVPQVVQLTHREHTAIVQNLSLLHAAGFDLEDFGGRSVQVRAVPMVLGAPQVKGFFGELADRLSEYRALPTEEKRRDALIKLACRKAVKAGDPLAYAQVERLVEEIRASGVSPTCPHGRPIVVCIEKAEFDKRFRRIV